MPSSIQYAVTGERRALALAVLGHGLLVVLVLLVPREAPPSLGLRPDDEVAIDMDADEAAPVPTTAAESARPAERAERAAGAQARPSEAARIRNAVAAAVVGPEPPAPSELGPAPPSPEAPPADTWTFRPTLPGTPDGVFAPPPLRPVNPAAGAAERGNRPDARLVGRQIMGGLLDAEDQARGLGRGGPVVSAVHAASLAIADAQNGDATIEVITDEAGNVTDVRLLDSTSDRGVWVEAARAVAAELRGRKIAVPPGAHGMAITVHVEVAMRYPSGARAGVEIQGAGIGFDVSDIGTHPRPVVHATIVNERRL